MARPISTDLILDANLIHRQLSDLLRLHQKAVLDKEFQRAKVLWKTYEIALKAHMKEEDEILLPLYRQRVIPQRGGAPEHFSGEHQKITEWMGRLRLRVSRLSGASLSVRDIIALLDDEAFFKKFMEHHSLREDHLFYPALAQVVNEKEKSALGRLLSFKLEDQDPLE